VCERESVGGWRTGRGECMPVVCVWEGHFCLSWSMCVCVIACGVIGDEMM
jgi:hypothetical protein